MMTQLSLVRGLDGMGNPCKHRSCNHRIRDRPVKPLPSILTGFMTARSLPYMVIFSIAGRKANSCFNGGAVCRGCGRSVRYRVGLLH